MSADDYKVAVQIKLVENVTRGLSMMARHFKTTDAEAAALEKRLQNIGKLTLAGGLLAGAGAFGLSLFKQPIEEAKKYETELAKITGMGLGPGVTAHADKFAKNAQVIGNSARDMAVAYGDALSVFKNTAEADFATPIMAQLRFANMALHGEAGEGRNSATLAMLKAIESRGGTKSEAEFARQADSIEKIVNASGGRVDARQWMSVMQTGGILAKQMSNDAFYLKGEPLVQEIGGFRYGTGLNALYNNFGQGRGSIASQQELMRLGAIDRSKVEFNKQGKLKKALPGAFRGMDSLVNGNVEGLVDYLLPLFKAKGITGDKAILAEFGQIASNSRGASLLGAAYLQREKLAKQSAANAKALGIKDTVGVASGTPAGKELALEAREATLKLRIGQIAMPVYVKMLELVAGALDRINAIAKDNPAAFKGMVLLFGAVSAAALTGGSLTLLVAGFRGLALVLPILRGGLTLVSVAFRGLMSMLIANPIGLAILAIIAVGLLVWNNWREIKANLIKIWGDIKEGVTRLFHGDILGALTSFAAVFIRGWQTIFNTLIAGLNTILPSALQISKFHFADDFDARFNSGNTVRPSASGNGKQGDVYIDGKHAGRIMAPHITREQTAAAGRPRTGGTSPDWSQSRAPVSIAFPR